jgi:hypothetical protein
LVNKGSGPQNTIRYHMQRLSSELYILLSFYVDLGCYELCVRLPGRCVATYEWHKVAGRRRYGTGRHNLRRSSPSRRLAKVRVRRETGNAAAPRELDRLQDACKASRNRSRTFGAGFNWLGEVLGRQRDSCTQSRKPDLARKVYMSPPLRAREVTGVRLASHAAHIRQSSTFIRQNLESIKKWASPSIRIVAPLQFQRGRRYPQL